MPIFDYLAQQPNQQAKRGTLAADTARQARDQLRAQGLSVLRLQETQARDKTIALSWLNRRARCPQGFVSDLATLLAVDVPIVQALDTLVEQYRGGFKTALLSVRDAVASGQSLAQAFSGQSPVFDPMTIHMTEVGEVSGTLDNVLRRLADYQRRHHQLKDRVVTALLYPALVAIASLIVTVFLLTYVTPMLIENLEAMGSALPWPTQVLKTCSDFLQAYWPWLTAFVISAVVALRIWVRSKSGRRRYQSWLIRVPLLGSMIRRQEISRAALVLATLLGSGIVLTRALEIVERLSNHVLLRDALQRCRYAITEGQDLGKAVGDTRFFPSVVTHIFVVGQESGQLEGMLNQLAEDYDAQVQALATRLSSVIEPALIVLLTFVVGFILFATMLPILEAGNVL